TGAQRAHAAAHAFAGRRGGLAALRRAAGGTPVVLLDDIVTTGYTLAGLAGVLAAAGVPVRAAAVLAATVRRLPPRCVTPESTRRDRHPVGSNFLADFYQTRGDGSRSQRLASGVRGGADQGPPADQP
ncbi:MAG TPA: hypothetical protein VES42_12310, partial [Pilimelia sp.]|nr:hypothetical protein [Pilimelia sp.]